LTILLNDGTRREVAITVAAAAPPALTVPAAGHPGQSLTVSGSGYAPGTLVTIRLNGMVVGVLPANISGGFTFTFTIPVATPLGVSTLVAEGVAPGGARRLASGSVSLT
jgi:hypothetical protein